MKPWATYSQSEANPALSRRLGCKPPRVPSNVNFSMILWPYSSLILGIEVLCCIRLFPLKPFQLINSYVMRHKLYMLHCSDQQSGSWCVHRTIYHHLTTTFKSTWTPALQIALAVMAAEIWQGIKVQHSDSLDLKKHLSQKGTFYPEVVWAGVGSVTRQTCQGMLPLVTQAPCGSHVLLARPTALAAVPPSVRHLTARRQPAQSVQEGHAEAFFFKLKKTSYKNISGDSSCQSWK